MPRIDRGARSDTRQRRGLQGLRVWLAVTPVRTADCEALYGEMVLVNPTSAGFTVSLPRAGDHRDELIGVKNVSDSTNTMTYDAAGAELIDGQASHTSASGRSCVIFQSDGTGWLVVNEYP